MDLAYFGRPMGVQSGSKVKTYHFCASFLNHTGSVKKTQNLVYICIPKGETKWDFRLPKGEIK